VLCLYWLGYYQRDYWSSLVQLWKITTGIVLTFRQVNACAEVSHETMSDLTRKLPKEIFKAEQDLSIAIFSLAESRQQFDGQRSVDE
jgi:hypothetical protein